MKKIYKLTVTACLWMACWTAPLQKALAQAISPNVMEITYPAPGSYTITVPERVVYTAEAWGGGGGGGSAGSELGNEGWGGGGGGGAYAALTNHWSSNPLSFSLTVGKGGNGGDGRNILIGFISNNGAAGGNTTVAIPALMINMSAGGGSGGEYGLKSRATAGNGGAPGGDYDVGTSGENGGTGDNTKGGNSPNGGLGSPETVGDNDGGDGERPGGGGGGAKVENLLPTVADGGNGGDGQIRLTLTFPVPAITSPTTQLCQGSVLRLSVTDPASAHVNYTWYRNGVQVGIGTEYDAGSDGDYTVRAEYIIPYTGASPVFRQASGSGNSITTTVSNTITLTVSAPPQINPIMMNSCSGEAITVTPMNGVHGFIPNGITYQWTVLQNTGGITGATTGNSGVTSLISLGTLVNPTNTTQTIVFEVTPGSVGCTNVTPFQISVNVKPAPQINPITRTVCSGESQGITPVDIVDGVVPDKTAYLWTVVSNSGVTGASNGNSGNSSTIYLGALTNTTNDPQKVVYEVTPTYEGCTGNNFQLEITVSKAITVKLISDNDFYWDGGSAQLKAIASPAGSYTYDWYRDNLLVLANGGDTYTSTEPARFAAYQYHVTVNDGSCTGISNVVPVTVSDAKTVAVILNYPDICESGTIRATAQIVLPDNYSYKWFLDGKEVGYERLFSASNLSVGKHTLAVEAKPVAPCNNCQTGNASVNFTVHRNPVVTIAADHELVSIGGLAAVRVTDIKLDSAVSHESHYTWQWALNGTIINGAVQSVYNQILSAPGIYVFTARMVATDDVGCTSEWSNPATVTVDESAGIWLLSDNTGYCEGGSIQLTANVLPVGKYTCDWYLDNVLLVSNSSQTFVSKGLTPRQTPYNYQVVARSSDTGFEYRSNVLPIMVYAMPTVAVLTDNTNVCRGGTFSATAYVTPAGDYDYKWYLNGEVSGYERQFSVDNLAADTYTVYVKVTPHVLYNGCEATSTPVTFSAHSNIEVPAFFQTDCDEGNVNAYRTVQIPINVLSGSPQTYSIRFTDLTRSSFNRSGNVRRNEPWGSYIEAHLPLQAGDYQVTIDIDGCLYASTVRVLFDSQASEGVRLIEQSWDDVLTVNNNPQTNGGYVFYAYQWYKNNVLIPGATRQYYTESDGRLNGKYHVALEGYVILSSGAEVPVSFTSCPVMPTLPYSLRVYPVPVQQNRSFMFTVSLTEAELTGAIFEIYDITGKLHRKITDLSPQMTIEGFAMKGIYFGRLVTRNREVREVKFVVM